MSEDKLWPSAWQMGDTMTDQEMKQEEEFEIYWQDRGEGYAKTCLLKSAHKETYLQACKVREIESNKKIESLIKFIPIDSQLDSNTMIHLLTGLLKKEVK